MAMKLTVAYDEQPSRELVQAQSSPPHESRPHGRLFLSIGNGGVRSAGHVRYAYSRGPQAQLQGFSAQRLAPTEAFGFVIWGMSNFNPPGEARRGRRGRNSMLCTPMQNPACGSLRRKPKTPLRQGPEEGELHFRGCFFLLLGATGPITKRALMRSGLHLYCHDLHRLAQRLDGACGRGVQRRAAQE